MLAIFPYHFFVSSAPLCLAFEIEFFAATMELSKKSFILHISHYFYKKNTKEFLVE